jgi:anthranilate/para-aminobenzoate synthase component II
MSPWAQKVSKEKKVLHFAEKQWKKQSPAEMYVNSLNPVASGHYHSQLLTLFECPSEGNQETDTAK